MGAAHGIDDLLGMLPYLRLLCLLTRSVVGCIKRFYQLGIQYPDFKP